MATESSVESRSDRSLIVDAVIGAIVSVVLGFVPFSPVLGGAVSGYLHRRDGLKVGAVSGLIASIPVFLVFMFLLTALSIGGMMGGAPGGGLALAGIFVVFAFAFWMVVAAGLGAIGGLVGEALVESA